MDRAPDYESGGWGFESLCERQFQARSDQLPKMHIGHAEKAVFITDHFHGGRRGVT